MSAELSAARAHPFFMEYYEFSRLWSSFCLNYQTVFFSNVTESSKNLCGNERYFFIWALDWAPLIFLKWALSWAPLTIFMVSVSASATFWWASHTLIVDIIIIIINNQTYFRFHLELLLDQFEDLNTLLHPMSPHNRPEINKNLDFFKVIFEKFWLTRKIIRRAVSVMYQFR